MYTENPAEAQRVIWPADVWLYQWACVTHKPCKLKYLQNEYKKHKVHMNVKNKDLLHYWILPAN